MGRGIDPVAAAAAATAACGYAEGQHDGASARSQKARFTHCTPPLKPLKNNGFPERFMLTKCLLFDEGRNPSRHPRAMDAVVILAFLVWYVVHYIRHRRDTTRDTTRHADRV